VFVLHVEISAVALILS